MRVVVTTSTTTGDGSCCCGSGSGSGPTVSCCLGTVPNSVTMQVLSAGTTGCNCIGTQVLPFDPATGTWHLDHSPTCALGDMTYAFSCFFDGTFWYWAASVTCNFPPLFPVVFFISAPMASEPTCCPIDVTFPLTAAPATIGACCGGTAPYFIQVRVTASCP